MNDLKKQKFVRYFGDKNIDGLGEVFVKEKLLFKAEIGETNGQAAVSLKSRI